MSDQDVETQKTTDQPENPYEELLKQITDPDGRQKYESVEEALKGSIHAQKHISTLEQDNQQIKEENTRMQEFLDKLAEKPEDTTSQAATTEESATTDTTESPKPESTQQEFSKEDLFAEWEARQQEKERERIETQNKETAIAKLEEAYADKAVDHLKAKAQELGVDPQYLLNMAATSPKLFSTTMGLTQDSKPKNSWSNSSINSSAMPDTSERKPEYNGQQLRSTRAAINFWENNC